MLLPFAWKEIDIHIGNYYFAGAFSNAEERPFLNTNAAAGRRFNELRRGDRKIRSSRSQ